MLSSCVCLLFIYVFFCCSLCLLNSFDLTRLDISTPSDAVLGWPEEGSLFANTPRVYLGWQGQPLSRGQVFSSVSGVARSDKASCCCTEEGTGGCEFCTGAVLWACSRDEICGRQGSYTDFLGSALPSQQQGEVPYGLYALA